MSPQPNEPEIQWGYTLGDDPRVWRVYVEQHAWYLAEKRKDAVVMRREVPAWEPADPARAKSTA
jgi:hypothetical protein